MCGSSKISFYFFNYAESITHLQVNRETGARSSCSTHPCFCSPAAEMHHGYLPAEVFFSKVVSGNKT